MPCTNWNQTPVSHGWTRSLPIDAGTRQRANLGREQAFECGSESKPATASANAPAVVSVPAMVYLAKATPPSCIEVNLDALTSEVGTATERTLCVGSDLAVRRESLTVSRAECAHMEDGDKARHCCRSMLSRLGNHRAAGTGNSFCSWPVIFTR
jgi:hypothetical protein